MGHMSFTSELLRYALCNPQGRPVLIAQSFDLCLGQYVDMRKGIIVDDESRRQYFEVLKRRKWSIRHAVIKCEVGSETITELPDGEGGEGRRKSKAKA